jgi:cytolysin-activating lysine-acyltransferase
MNLPRYRHQRLADLAHLFVTPLMHGRVAIAHKAAKAPGAAAGAVDETVIGIAVWATVSDAVDAKITEQIKAGCSLCASGRTIGSAARRYGCWMW